MSEVRPNSKPRDCVLQNFFVTCNYVNVENGAEKIKQHIKKLSEINDGNKIQAIMCWEERGLQTGNPHWHGIFIMRRCARMRPLQFKCWLMQIIPDMPEPHVEPCRNTKDAAEYRD